MKGEPVPRLLTLPSFLPSSHSSRHSHESLTKSRLSLSPSDLPAWRSPPPAAFVSLSLSSLHQVRHQEPSARHGRPESECRVLLCSSRCCWTCFLASLPVCLRRKLLQQQRRPSMLLLRIPDPAFLCQRIALTLFPSSPSSSSPLIPSSPDLITHDGHVCCEVDTAFPPESSVSCSHHPFSRRVRVLRV